MILLDHRGGLSMGTLTKAIAKFKGGVKVPHNKNTAEFENCDHSNAAAHWRCLYADG